MVVKKLENGQAVPSGACRIEYRENKNVPYHPFYEDETGGVIDNVSEAECRRLGLTANLQNHLNGVNFPKSVLTDWRSDLSDSEWKRTVEFQPGGKPNPHQFFDRRIKP